MTELIASLREKAEKGSALPIFPGEMTTTDVVVQPRTFIAASEAPPTPSSSRHRSRS